MVEVQENGQTYRIGKLDAFKQFHVSRKIAPIIPTLVPVFVKIARDGNATADIAGMAAVLQPFADGVAAMRDEDAEFVLATCLAVVSRRTSAGWAQIWSTQARACMFDDMDLGVLMKLALQVIQESLGPFIRGLLTSQQEESPSSLPAAG